MMVMMMMMMMVMLMMMMLMMVVMMLILLMRERKHNYEAGVDDNENLSDIAEHWYNLRVTAKIKSCI